MTWSVTPVGIGMTLCNRAAYLTEAVESLLAQSYGEFKLVLVDDGSTDETENLARAFEQRDPRVKYVRCAERWGMVAAWRAAFEQATAEGASYFAWASDHDRWHPRWLQTLVNTLEQYPRCRARVPADTAHRSVRCAAGEAGAPVRNVRRC